MGLLDQFSNLNEEQTQGLLAAAAQMLQQSGPSRTPTGLGQILGGGMMAYQDGSAASRKRKLEEDAAKQSGLLRGLQIQEAQGGLADHGRARQQADDLRQFYIQQRLGKAPNAAPDAAVAPQMASAMPGGSDSPKIGGPDWMQAFQAGQLAPAPSAPQQAAQGDPYSQRMATAQQLRGNGFHAEADAQEAAALKFKPKFETKPQVVRGPDGKPMLVQTADDGTVRALPGGYGVAEKMEFRDAGGKLLGLDAYSGTELASIRKTQSPDSIATDQRAAADRQASPDALLPNDTLAMMAQQYRAGDTSVMQNLGRGAQGAQNIIRLRNEISRQTAAAGQGGSDLAAKNAEFFGTKAGQRSAGTRIANVEMASSEAESLIPLARQASAAVARSGLLPFGKAQVMFDNQTNDPALRQFAAANNALVNVYSRAISPSGVPTVADKEHAREMISTAIDDRSYQAVLDQMQKEITAARAAPKAVRKAFNDEVTGKGHNAEPATGAVRKYNPATGRIE